MVNFHKQRGIIFTISGIMLVYVIIVAIMPMNAFWVNDNGNKYILTQQFLLTGSPAVTYPANDLDPDWRFFTFPIYKAGEQADAGSSPEKRYSVFSFYFPWLVSYLHSVFGIISTSLPSLFGMLGTLIATVLIARRLRISQFYSCILGIMAFASPLFFYSVSFWEHTLALMLASFALYFVLKSFPQKANIRNFICAGLLLGLASVFREEGYVLFAALGLALLLTRYRLSFLLTLSIGFALVIIPLWIFQYCYLGHFLGIHGLAYMQMQATQSQGGLLDKLLSKAVDTYFFLFAFSCPSTGKRFLPFLSNILLISPFFAAFSLGILSSSKEPVRKIKLIVLACCCISSVILFIRLAQSSSPMFATLTTKGLLTSIPFLVFPFLFWHDVRRMSNAYKILLMTAFFYCIGILFILNRGNPGLSWSARHFLVVIPLLVLVAFYQLKHIAKYDTSKWYTRSLYAILAALLLVSIGMQLYSVRLLYQKKTATSLIVDAVNASDCELVMTDIFYLPEDLATVYFKKKIMLVKSSNDFINLLNILKQKKVTKALLILSNRHRCIDHKLLNSVLQKCAASPPQQTKSNLPNWNVWLIELDLSRPVEAVQSPK